jgi:hypothetical protein
VDVVDIVRKYLVEKGYDGLCSDDSMPCWTDCCCDLGDFMCCDYDSCGISCSPGYKVPCVCEGTNKHKFHIVPQKGGSYIKMESDEDEDEGSDI